MKSRHHPGGILYDVPVENVPVIHPAISAGVAEGSGPVLER